MTLLLTRMWVESRDEAPWAHPSETHLSVYKHYRSHLAKVESHGLIHPP